jgi:hypothetical protein
MIKFNQAVFAQMIKSGLRKTVGVKAECWHDARREIVHPVRARDNDAVIFFDNGQRLFNIQLALHECPQKV